MWNLWNLVNVPKLHTGKLYIRQLWLGETCEGFFRTLLKFFNFFYGTKKSAEVLVKREGVFLFREDVFQKHQHVLGNCWRRISNASSTIVARNYLFGKAKMKMRIRPSVWACLRSILPCYLNIEESDYKANVFYINIYQFLYPFSAIIVHLFKSSW